MTDRQKIKMEIQLQITNLEAAKEEGFITEFGRGQLECLDGLLSFIDFLPPMFSATQRGIIDEIISTLRFVGKERKVSYHNEINFLKNLREL